LALGTLYHISPQKSTKNLILTAKKSEAHVTMASGKHSQRSLRTSDSNTLPRLAAEVKFSVHIANPNPKKKTPETEVSGVCGADTRI